VLREEARHPRERSVRPWSIQHTAPRRASVAHRR
jgi:hypothetical protein